MSFGPVAVVNAGAHKCADQRQWIYLPATRYAPTAECLSQLLESIGTINETNQRRGTLARIAAGGKCFSQLTKSAVRQGILATWRSTCAAPGRRSTNCSRPCPARPCHLFQEGIAGLIGRRTKRFAVAAGPSPMPKSGSPMVVCCRCLPQHRHYGVPGGADGCQPWRHRLANARSLNRSSP
jgi:hypothetical protein